MCQKGSGLRGAITIVLRVGVPMAGGMWVLAELARGTVVSEMGWPALLLAGLLIFAGFNQAIKIADDRLNDPPEGMLTYE